MKSSLFGRSIKLLNMASQLAGHEVVKNVKEKLVTSIEDRAPELVKTRIAQAKIVAENLSALKGAAMKAGQLLSLDSSDLLPPEVIDILSQLQFAATAEPYSVIAEVLQTELGPERLSQFEWIDPQPLASASIGQVHRARLKGEEVVLKVQYPGVAASIDSDLAILKKVTELFVNVSGRKMDLTETFQELGIVLHQEADYLQELQNLERFRSLCQNESELIVPRGFADFSSKKVLCLSYEVGNSVVAWIQSQPSLKEREWLGSKILDLYCSEFFDWGLVQTDPNYGNFKIQNQPSKLVLLDFGATLSYDLTFRQRYVDFLRSFASGDNDRILKSALAFGLIDPRESEETMGIFIEFLEASVEPFLPKNQPFKFKDEEYARRAHEVGRKFTGSLKYSAPPRQLIFLHRKLGGIFNLLRKLDVSINLTPYWKRMVGEEYLLTQESPPR